MNPTRKFLLTIALFFAAWLGMGALCPTTAPDVKDTQDRTISATATARPDNDNDNSLSEELENLSSDNDSDLDFMANNALDYPDIEAPQPEREPVFPDVKKGSRRPLAEYLESWESNDYFHNDVGDVDVAQWYWRNITSGRIRIRQADVDCTGDHDTACLVVIINHFGDAFQWEDATVDTGFTGSGLVFDMGTPGKTIQAAQALLDHQVYRLTVSENGINQGSNCSTHDACKRVKWYVIIVGNGEVQAKWSGIYHR